MKRILPGLLFCSILLSFQSYAQPGELSGYVTDATDHSPLPGVSVVVKGATLGTSTDLDGRYTLQVRRGDTLRFTFIGYQPYELVYQGQEQADVQLRPDLSELEEVVVVGYGTQRRQDLTGSITSISEKDFVKAPVTTPEQLVLGKVAGVQITPNQGNPGSGSRIRIRGGSSLNASNDPLIVIDGVPLDNNDLDGAPHPLSMINPNDIASFNILKDASATAIYGSRASNGVVIITTKKGRAGDPLRISFSSIGSLSRRTGGIDVLGADEFRQVIGDLGNDTHQALLGEADTDWQDVIYRDAYSSDNNLSLSGALGSVPYRLSLGYLGQNGILKTSDMQRTSGALNLSPAWLDDHLHIDLNLKGALSDNRFANQGAINLAAQFDPTQPVYADDPDLGGYFEWLDPSTGRPNTLAARNPLSMLEQRRDESRVKRSIGNIVVDYRMHFLPELRANLNLGYDISESKGTIFVPETAGSDFNRGGIDNRYSQSKNNKLLEFYLNYTKELGDISSRLDVTAGYTYQDWIMERPSYPDQNVSGEIINEAGVPLKTQNTLISFFGRVNYSVKDRYLLTATLRRDGSSRFHPDNRWGTFPSAALAWRISEEPFLQGAASLSDLKLRLGYGLTGQQDITGGDYPYLARYTLSDPSARYQFGDVFYHTLRPEGYDAEIKWEETETYNAGMDFEFLEGRIAGSLDYYFKKTSDLLSIIPVPAGTNLTNQLLTNVGNIENRGFEFVINTVPVQGGDFNWELGVNFTWNKNTITSLSRVNDPNSPGTLVGGIAGGVGHTIQIHSIGHNPYAFYVYKQVYDQDGNPVEDLYADMNDDGIINDSDRYRYKTPDPRAYVGLSSQFAYKQWSLGFVMRGNIGNYVYNNYHSNYGVYGAAWVQENTLNNLSSSVLESGFTDYQFISDYYVENASFLRMDNLNLGYDFGRIKDRFGLRLSAVVQNVFVITRYTGADPEIAGGIDNEFYLRPRIFSLGLHLDF